MCWRETDLREKGQLWREKEGEEKLAAIANVREKEGGREAEEIRQLEEVRRNKEEAVRKRHDWEQAHTSQVTEIKRDLKRKEKQSNTSDEATTEEFENEYTIKVHIEMNPDEPLPEYLQAWLARDVNEPPKKKTHNISIAEPISTRLLSEQTATIGTPTSTTNIGAYTVSESMQKAHKVVVASEKEEEEEHEEEEIAEPIVGEKRKDRKKKKKKVEIPPLVDPYKVVFKEYVRFVSNKAKDYYMNIHKRPM